MAAYEFDFERIKAGRTRGNPMCRIEGDDGGFIGNGWLLSDLIINDRVYAMFLLSNGDIVVSKTWSILPDCTQQYRGNNFSIGCEREAHPLSEPCRFEWIAGVEDTPVPREELSGLGDDLDWADGSQFAEETFYDTW